MGISKAAYFTEHQNNIAKMARALSNPARVAILEHIMKADACICGDLVDALPLAQPTISQHLKELKLAGLIKGAVEGNAICYCIDEQAIRHLQSYFEGIFNQLNAQKKDCC